MMRRNRLDSLTTWKSPALSSDGISAPQRFARRLMLLSAVAMALNGCQTLIDQSYQPSVSPSSNPQIVDEVQKNDPRAAMGAREHPRIVASY
ncbi:metalloprotease, partial [Rhizobium ruizarguesonis]